MIQKRQKVIARTMTHPLSCFTPRNSYVCCTNGTLQTNIFFSCFTPYLESKSVLSTFKGFSYLNAALLVSTVKTIPNPHLKDYSLFIRLKFFPGSFSPSCRLVFWELKKERYSNQVGILESHGRHTVE